MAKIPVGAAIGGAYRFAFGGFPGNLGVVWLPVLLVMAAAWWLIPLYIAAMGEMVAQITAHPKDPALALAGMQQAYRWMVIFWISALFLRAEIMLGLTRRALGEKLSPGFVFLSAGKPFWRLAGAYLALTIIFMTAEVVLVLGFALVAFIVGGILAVFLGTGKETIVAIAGVAAVIGMTTVLGALFYGTVRLSFLLTPVIVAEGRFDLIRPWKLFGRNFWRVVAIGISIFIPLGLLYMAVFVPWMVWVLHPLIARAPHVSSHDPRAAAKVIAFVSAALMQAMRTSWLELVPLGLAGSSLIYGIAAGAAVHAYRALAPAGSAAAPLA